MITLLASCSIESEAVRVGALPLCGHTNTGRLILMAQSVPSAQMIPCVEELPEGWRLEHADVENGSSRLQFENVAGVDVVVQLLPSCTPTGDFVILLRSGAKSYQVIDETRRLDEYVFPGGCIRLEAPLGEDAGRMADAIDLLPKDILREASGWELPD